MTIRSTILLGITGSILQVTEGQQYAVTSMFFCNTSTTNRVLQVHLVPGDGSPTNENKIINDLIIGPGDTFTFDTEKIILDSKDSVQAQSQPAGGISATVSYVRVA
jgi:hypothetical protein